MHTLSFEKTRSIRDVYIPPRSNVLDVGSATMRSKSYGQLFRPPDYECVGLDISDAPNVSLVVRDAYNWIEIDNDSFDAAVSGQMFEHNPYFWVTAAEMARVVKPGGIVAVIAPSTGDVHRHPFDCWRFYPDAWLSLSSYVGLELVESYVERPSTRKRVDGLPRHPHKAFVVYWLMAKRGVLPGPNRVRRYNNMGLPNYPKRLDQVERERCVGHEVRARRR